MDRTSWSMKNKLVCLTSRILISDRDIIYRSWKSSEQSVMDGSSQRNRTQINLDITWSGTRTIHRWVWRHRLVWHHGFVWRHVGTLSWNLHTNYFYFRKRYHDTTCIFLLPKWNYQVLYTSLLSCFSFIAISCALHILSNIFQGTKSLTTHQRNICLQKKRCD